MYKGMRSIKVGSLNKNNDYSNIKEAIRKTICQKFHAREKEEKAQIDKIEQIRKFFAQNPTQVEVIDFGAGDPNSKRSDSECQKVSDLLLPMRKYLLVVSRQFRQCYCLIW